MSDDPIKRYGFMPAGMGDSFREIEPGEHFYGSESNFIKHRDHLASRREWERKVTAAENTTFKLAQVLKKRSSGMARLLEVGSRLEWVAFNECVADQCGHEKPEECAAFLRELCKTFELEWTAGLAAAKESMRED